MVVPEIVTERRVESNARRLVPVGRALNSAGIGVVRGRRVERDPKLAWRNARPGDPRHAVARGEEHLVGRLANAEPSIRPRAHREPRHDTVLLETKSEHADVWMPIPI